MLDINNSPLKELSKYEIALFCSPPYEENASKSGNCWVGPGFNAKWWQCGQIARDNSGESSQRWRCMEGLLISCELRGQGLYYD